MPTVRATIVQISDLHLTYFSDKSVQSMVKLIVAKERPDVLVVSGDVANQPVPWQMKRAARFVEEVRQVCKPEAPVLVISGNHDFKFFGNIGLRRLTRVPFEIYFRRNGLSQGFWWRFVRYLGLSLNALWPWGKLLADPLQFIRLEEAGIALAGINSNSLAEMMAAGRVEPTDLQALYSRVDEEARGEAGFVFHYKIAVVHHHPAPIADVATKFADRVQESFMVFYNAGTFLREVNRRGFNLVLHGHKHFAGFLRVAMDFPGKGHSELPIAAAGSACHNHPDDPRGHHLHVIQVFDDDTATLKSLFFSPSVESTEATRTYELDRLEDVQRRRFQVFREKRGMAVHEIRKVSRITLDGYTDVQLEWRRCRIHREEGLDGYPIEYEAGAPAYLRSMKVADVEECPSFLRLTDKVRRLREYGGVVEFGRRYRPGEPPFSFGVSYRLINAHTLTPREFQRHYAERDQRWEEVALFCNVAAEALTIEVQFPDGYSLDDERVEAYVEYIPAPLKGVNDADFDHSYLTPHERESSRARESLQIRPGKVSLTIHNPIPGFLYKIRWMPVEQGDPPTPPPLEVEVAVREFQESMCRVARETAEGDPEASAEYQLLVDLLDTLAEDFTALCNLRNEELNISAMVFRQEESKLYTVCANYGQIGEMLKEPFEPGEGCAGFVFEKIRPVLYHAARDTTGHYIDPGERPECGAGMIKAEVLFCVPWVQDGIVVGVVNVISQKKNSGLLRLFDLPEDSVERRALEELVKQAAANLFRMVNES